MTPFFSLSLQSNIDKRKQIITQLKMTINSISTVNKELMTEIKSIKESLPHSKIDKNELQTPKIDFSFNFAEESMVANVGSKSPYNFVLEESSFGILRESPIGKDSSIKYFTPEPIRTKSRINNLHNSLEKNLGGLPKKTKSYFEPEINFETVESESLIIEEKRKKHSQILYEEMYMNNLGNDFHFQEKPKTIMKVKFD